ncbi:MAG: hypothetical protein R3310_07655 [Candidatus Competibacteraceae bacterium]|nr:hypothetical protein [Candidatus Competibacteraceae bacterium]
MRSIMRKMMGEEWRISHERFDIDEQGYGTVIYRIDTPGERYSQVIFSHYLDPAERSDRVIAQKWDVACALCEGEISAERLEELRTNIPLQEAGRNRAGDIVLSRANKSVRNFDYLVDVLAQGRQPDPAVLAKVGYLLRTTAVYGNGKFGIADYARIRGSRAFALPFSAQMFAVYLLRHFSIELVEHLARVRAPATAVPLDDAIRRYIGTGNATGLGMAPFLVNHPRLLDRWLRARETAIARVLYRGRASRPQLARLRGLVERAGVHLRETQTDDQRQALEYQRTLGELEDFHARVTEELERFVGESAPGEIWRRLSEWAESHGSLETQELINSLLMELYPELVDDLEERMAADETSDLAPDMPLDDLMALIEDHYHWALAIDFNRPEEQQLFWYRSAEKEEPRLGERGLDPGADKEFKLTTVARTVQELYRTLQGLSRAERSGPTVAFLLRYPRYRGIVRRIQSLRGYEYGEVRANLLHRDTLPIHLLRAKLSFFGASKFDPKSDRWVRISLFQGAPLVADIGRHWEDDWSFPCMPARQPERLRP